MNDLQIIVEEKNAWEAKNFPNTTKGSLQNAVLGVIEETGELAHAHLKADQGIRGTEDEHAAAARDAIGDCLIYLIGVAKHSGVEFVNAVYIHQDPHTLSPELAIFRLANRVGRLASDLANFPQLTTRHIGEIYWALGDYCRHRDWDIMEILIETWNEVKQRDWTKNKVDGSAA